MKEARNSSTGPAGNKTVVIKAGGAGGIGAVVLLGGALAAAAFASAFALRHKRRSSGEDSSPEINKKSENSKGGDGVVELEDDSSGMISDQSLKLEDDANVERADENDAVSDSDFVIVEEEFPMVAVKEDVSGDHSKEGHDILAEREGDDGDGDGDAVIVARSDEEDAEEREMRPRQEENNHECHDHENNAQTNEFEGLCNVNGETDEQKCVEKAVLQQFEGHAIQQDNLIGDEEEVPLPTDGVEMFRVGNTEEKPVEEHKHVDQSDEGQIQIGGEAKQNYLSHDPTPVRLDKFMEGENGVMREIYGKKDTENEAEEVKVVENGEARTEKTIKNSAESRKESSVMKYEVGGKIEEHRAKHESKLTKKEEGAWRVMIWMACVVSTLSCSWFLELSYAKLGLLVLMTVFLLEMYGYSLQKEILAMTKDDTTDI